MRDDLSDHQVQDQTANETRGPGQPAIVGRGLTKLFGGRRCVDNLNLEVRQGDIYALLGDNGAGKTTTVNMLVTLLSPDAGHVSICGVDVLRHPERAKRTFGVVSQDLAIYKELTGYENLRFIADLYGIAGAAADRRIRALLDQCGLLDRANDLAGQYSLGMQRKLAIAAAILPEPRVLFMDEPTVGLDPGSRRHIWETLSELRQKGVTILLTTHYLEEAELLADRVGIIRRGKMVIEGSIDELRQRTHGIGGIVVALRERVSLGELERRLADRPLAFPTSISFDPLRNRVTFAVPSSVALERFLASVSDWLREESLGFFSLETAEPSLEDIFLSVASQRAAVEVPADGCSDGEAAQG